MDIHENIKIYRKKRQLTQAELAAKVGTTKQTIQRYETGEIKNIPYDKITSIAKVLLVSPGVLMGIEEEYVEAELQGTDEADLLKKYSLLDDRGKKAVKDLIETILNLSNIDYE